MKARRILRESNEALREGYGFANQREDCLKFENQHGIEVIKEHQLVESSSTWKREEFDHIIQQAIADKDEIPVIVFPRVDRFARNLEAAGYYLGLLRRNGLVLMFAQENLIVDNEASAMQVFTFFIHSFKADQDGKQLRHNLLGGRDKLPEKTGQVPNGAIIWPFDYHPKKVYGQMTTGKPFVNDQRAEWVRRWAKSILEEGIGINAIEKWMDEKTSEQRGARRLLPRWSTTS